MKNLVALTAFVRLVALVLVVPAAFAQELTPQQIAARTRPAVVLVKALSNGQVIGTGSGFVISADGKLVTNHHVLVGADQVQIQLSSEEIYDVVHFVNDDVRRDLAILQIPETGLVPLPIGDDRATVVGDRIYVLGNPLGLEGTFSDGLISAKRTVDGVSLIQITAPISAGSSGGPVLNTRGEVIGIASRTLQEGQNLNLAIPARYAAGLLALTSEPQPFERVAHRFKESEDSHSPDSAASSSEGPTDMPQWAQDLASVVAELWKVVEENGFERSHELVVEMLQQGQTYDVEYKFSEAHRQVQFAAVCDEDCSDLDLGVLNRSGRLIAKDVQEDEYPMVVVPLDRPGTLTVRVAMPRCSVNPCGFALQAFVAE